MASVTCVNEKKCSACTHFRACNRSCMQVFL